MPENLVDVQAVLSKDIYMQTSFMGKKSHIRSIGIFRIRT